MLAGEFLQSLPAYFTDTPPRHILTQEVIDLAWKDKIFRILLYWSGIGRTGLSPVLFSWLMKEPVEKVTEILDNHEYVKEPFRCADTNLPIYRVSLLWGDDQRYHLTRNKSGWHSELSKYKEALFKFDTTLWTKEDMANFCIPGYSGKILPIRLDSIVTLWNAVPSTKVVAVGCNYNVTEASPE